MIKKQPPVAIGSTAQISFPDLGIENVPAKVDTGADSSSIWASDIKVSGGKLSFRVFGTGYVHYRRKVFTHNIFKATSVKNSFGQKEFRYKVKLKVKIGPKVISAWFTLANRALNKYPVLLGKSTLKGRFIVDVSKKDTFSQKPEEHKVLVLSSKPDLMRSFLEKVSNYNEDKVIYTCHDYNLLYDIFSGDTTVRDLVIGTDVSSYSYVYFKSRSKNAEFASALAGYLNFHSVPFSDIEVGLSGSTSKLTEYMKLASHGLSVPRTICAKPKELLKNYKYTKTSLGLPLVLKEISSDRGKNNYIVSNKKEYQSILADCPAEHIYLAQEHIPNEGFYRVQIFGKEVGLSVWRSPEFHTDKLKKHLNKPFNGANVSMVPVGELPTEVQNLAVRAAVLMNRQVAGLDILQDKHTKEWYILEVNNAPQIRKGHFVEENAKAFARFIDKELSS
ncbi:hypothetical protein BH23PAT1_BH23PAT1_3440 [soil metagenome]